MSISVGPSAAVFGKLLLANILKVEEAKSELASVKNLPPPKWWASNYLSVTLGGHLLSSIRNRLSL